jgi:DNA polymerase eta
MSAGISTNKTMAKLAASYGKPNGQAMLHPNYFCVVLSETKMKKVRNFGGALGNEVLSMLSNLRREEGGKEQSFDELKISVMMNDVRVISLPTLMRFFSQETAEHIFHAAQGIDNEPVKETSKALVKSITAFKSFPAMKNVTDIRNWIVVLANEIAERVTQDAVRNNRYPKTCTLNYSYYATPTATRPSTGSSRSARQSRSVRLNFPSERESIDRKSASLVEQSMHKVEEILKLHFKLCGIGLAAGNFEMRGPPQGMTSIQSFLRKMGEDSQSSSFRQQQGATTRSPLKTSLVGQPLKKKKKTGIATFFSSTESNPLTAGTVRDCESKSLQMKPSCEGPSSVGPISRHDVELSAATSNEDPDLELARRLQAQYDRENYVISRSETNRLWLQNSKKNKKNMAPKIDSFFTKKK